MYRRRWIQGESIRSFSVRSCGSATEKGTVKDTYWWIGSAISADPSYGAMDWWPNSDMARKYLSVHLDEAAMAQSDVKGASADIWRQNSKRVGRRLPHRGSSGQIHQERKVRHRA